MSILAGVDDAGAEDPAVVGLDDLAIQVILRRGGLAAPKFPHLQGFAAHAAQSHVRQGELRAAHLVRHVEHADGEVAALQQLDDDRGVGAARDDVGLTAGGILIDGQHVGVGQDIQGLLADVPDVAADHQRGIEHRPQREMGAVLLEGAAAHAHVAGAAHADHQHVHVVEAAGPVVGLDVHLLVEQGLDGFPVVKNIPGGTPHTRAGGFDPALGVLRAPAARAEQNVPPAVRQRRTHAFVQNVPRHVSGPVAKVVFQKIHAPRGEGGRVDKLILEAGGIARAGLVAGAGIHAELQPLAVDIIGQRLHAGGELFMTGHQPVAVVPFLFRPAVVDDQIGVARVPQAGGHHGVRRVAHQLLVDILAEGVPGVEAQCR